MDKKEFSLPVLLSLATAFFTFSGGLWHLGYWSTFDINYFEFASITDLFKSTVYPFFLKLYLISGLILLLVAASAFNKSEKIIQEGNTPDLIQKRPRSYNSNMTWIDFTIFFSAMFGAYIILGNYKGNALSVLPFLISIILICVLLRINFLKTMIQNSVYRYILITFIVTYPTFNFSSGKDLSKQIVSGWKASIITSYASGNKEQDILVLGRPYLGSSSEYHFIYIQPSQIEIVRKEAVQRFTLINSYEYNNLYETWLKPKLGYIIAQNFKDSISQKSITKTKNEYDLSFLKMIQINSSKK